MSEWRKAVVPSVMSANFPNARCWQKDLDDGHLSVLRTIERDSEESPWRTHVSISHRTHDLQPGRYPTWDEQKEAVWRFAPGKTMVSILPAEGEAFVNIHRTTFHWWEVPESFAEGIY